MDCHENLVYTNSAIIAICESAFRINFKRSSSIFENVCLFYKVVCYIFSREKEDIQKKADIWDLNKTIQSSTEGEWTVFLSKNN